MFSFCVLDTYMVWNSVFSSALCNTQTWVSTSRHTYVCLHNTACLIICTVHQPAQPCTVARLSTTIFVGPLCRWQRLERQNAVRLYRTYRTGELPDIQISLRELLDPLSALCMRARRVDRG